MSVDISVIVPVYNAENYLKQCVESIINQTHKNIEIIFVDDGSTDRSVEILENYKQNDPRIQILRQQNQYAGVARNNGMKTATGKYLIFLDSDDFFELNMLEEVFQCAERNSAEIVTFDYWNFNNKKQIDSVSTYVNSTKLPQAVFSAKDMGNGIFSWIIPVPWNKLLLRSFVEISELQYQEIKCHNDEYFNKMAVLLADRIVYLRKKFVHYRVDNDNSLQGAKQKSADKGVEYLIQVLCKLKDELEKRELLDGTVGNAYIALAHVWLSKYMNPNYTSSAGYEKVYNAIKSNLYPRIFKTMADFESDFALFNLYQSNCYHEFLFFQTRDLNGMLQDSVVPKSSTDYILGHALLAIPRKMKYLLKH